MPWTQTYLRNTHVDRGVRVIFSYNWGEIQEEIWKIEFEFLF